MLREAVEAPTCPGPWRVPIDRSGFSLLEMLVAVTAFSLVLGAGYSILFKVQGTYEARAASAALRQQGRLALQRLSDELRLAGYGLGNVPAAFIDAGEDRIVFAGDIDLGSDRAPCLNEAGNAGVELITYRFEDDRLERKVDCWDGVAWTEGIAYQTMASNLLGGEFLYFDATGAQMSTGGGGLTAAELEEIWRVSIGLELIDLDKPQTMGAVHPGFEIATAVAIRNANVDDPGGGG